MIYNGFGKDEQKLIYSTAELFWQWARRIISVEQKRTEHQQILREYHGEQFELELREKEVE